MVFYFYCSRGVENSSYILEVLNFYIFGTCYLRNLCLGSKMYFVCIYLVLVKVIEKILINCDINYNHIAVLKCNIIIFQNCYKIIINIMIHNNNILKKYYDFKMQYYWNVGLIIKLCYFIKKNSFCVTSFFIYFIC